MGAVTVLQPAAARGWKIWLTETRQALLRGRQSVMATARVKGPPPRPPGRGQLTVAQQCLSHGDLWLLLSAGLGLGVTLCFNFRGWAALAVTLFPLCI